MKLKTSCYDPALGRMELRRFAPVWLLYTVGLFLLFFATVTGRQYEGDAVIMSFYSFPQVTAICNFCYALVLVQLLFGDLYTTRLSYGLRALPITRGGWFGTQVILGIAGSLISNALLALVMPLRITVFTQTILWWFCASQLQFLFFFGVSILCAVCAGNRIGQILLYGIVNFLFILVMWAKLCLLVPLLFGVVIRNETLFLSPLFYMADAALFTFDYKSDVTAPLQSHVEFRDDGPTVIWQTGSYVGNVHLTDHLGYLAIYAAVGCAAIALAVFLYRRRKAECAGDLLAFPKMEPVFLVICTLCAGTVFHIAAYIFNTELGYPMLAVGMVLGYYICLMLLKRKTAVFTPKSILPLAGICGIVVLCLALTGLDLFGISQRVPKAEDLEKVTMSYASSDYRAKEPEEIAAALEIQQQALAEHRELENGVSLLKRIFETEDVDRWDYDELSGTLSMTFFTKDGEIIQREYPIHESSPGMPVLRKMFSHPEAVFKQTASWLRWKGEDDFSEELLKNMQVIMLRCIHTASEFSSGTTIEILPEDRAGLIDAILADCAEGHTAQYSVFSPASESVSGFNRFNADSLSFIIQPEGIPHPIYDNLSLNGYCTHTYQWLTAHGYHETESIQDILNP